MQHGKSVGGVPCTDFSSSRVIRRMALFRNYGAKLVKNALIRPHSLVASHIAPKQKLLRFLAVILASRHGTRSARSLTSIGTSYRPKCKESLPNKRFRWQFHMYCRPTGNLLITSGRSRHIRSVRLPAGEDAF